MERKKCARVHSRPGWVKSAAAASALSPSLYALHELYEKYYNVCAECRNGNANAQILRHCCWQLAAATFESFESCPLRVAIIEWVDILCLLESRTTLARRAMEQILFLVFYYQFFNNIFCRLTWSSSIQDTIKVTACEVGTQWPQSLLAECTSIGFGRTIYTF